MKYSTFQIFLAKVPNSNAKRRYGPKFALMTGLETLKRFTYVCFTCKHIHKNAIPSSHIHTHSTIIKLKDAQRPVCM